MLMGATVRRSNAGFPKKRRWITENIVPPRSLHHCSESFFGAPRECPSAWLINQRKQLVSRRAADLSAGRIRRTKERAQRLLEQGAKGNPPKRNRQASAS
jgi:hypothetical protein